MRTPWKILLLWGVLFFIASAQTKSREQTHFSAEDDHVQQAVRLPESAIALLAKDDMVRTVMDNEHAATLPQDWFLASVVHLYAASEADLLVIANGPLAGANVVNFWILKPSNGMFSVILNGTAHDLLLQKTLTNGYLSRMATLISSCSVRQP